MFNHHRAVINYFLFSILNRIINSDVVGLRKLNVPTIEFTPAGFVFSVGCIAKKDGNGETTLSVKIANNSGYGWPNERVGWRAPVKRILGNFNNQLNQLMSQHKIRPEQVWRRYKLNFVCDKPVGGESVGIEITTGKQKIIMVLGLFLVLHVCA